jgi:hypothetical protein
MKVSCAEFDAPPFVFSAKALAASVKTLGGIVTDGI